MDPAPPRRLERDAIRSAEVAEQLARGRRSDAADARDPVDRITGEREVVRHQLGRHADPTPHRRRSNALRPARIHQADRAGDERPEILIAAHDRDPRPRRCELPHEGRDDVVRLESLHLVVRDAERARHARTGVELRLEVGRGLGPSPLVVWIEIVAKARECEVGCRADVGGIEPAEQTE
jgi:hypothetical protein